MAPLRDGGGHRNNHRADPYGNRPRQNEGGQEDRQGQGEQGQQSQQGQGQAQGFGRGHQGQQGQGRGSGRGQNPGQHWSNMGFGRGGDVGGSNQVQKSDERARLQEPLGTWQLVQDEQGRITAGDIGKVSDNQAYLRVTSFDQESGTISSLTNRQEAIPAFLKYLQANGFLSSSREYAFHFRVIDRARFQRERAQLQRQQVLALGLPKVAIDQKKKSWKTPGMRDNDSSSDEAADIQNAEADIEDKEMPNKPPPEKEKETPAIQVAHTSGAEEGAQSTQKTREVHEERITREILGAVLRDLGEMISREVQEKLAASLSHNGGTINTEPTSATVATTRAPLPLSAPLRPVDTPQVPACANCDSRRHFLKDCMMCDESGKISGCPACNTKGHNLDICPKRHTEIQMLEFLVVMRQNKPPLNCRGGWFQRLQDFRAKNPLVAHRFLPWTSAFAVEVRANDALGRYQFVWDETRDYSKMVSDPCTKDMEAASSYFEDRY